MAEKNDTGASFFFGGKNAITIGIEQAEDRGVSLFPAAVLENPHVRVLGDRSLDLLGELNRTMVPVIVADESADETDYDVGRSRSCRSWLWPERCCIHCPGERRHSRSQDREGDDRSAK